MRWEALRPSTTTREMRFEREARRPSTAHRTLPMASVSQQSKQKRCQAQTTVQRHSSSCSLTTGGRFTIDRAYVITRREAVKPSTARREAVKPSTACEQTHTARETRKPSTEANKPITTNGGTRPHLVHDPKKNNAPTHTPPPRPRPHHPLPALPTHAPPPTRPFRSTNASCPGRRATSPACAPTCGPLTPTSSNSKRPTIVPPAPGARRPGTRRNP